MSATMPAASSSRMSSEQPQTKTIYIPAKIFNIDSIALKNLTYIIADGSMDNYPGFLLESGWYSTAQSHNATLLKEAPREYYDDASCLNSPKAKYKVW